MKKPEAVDLSIDSIALASDSMKAEPLLLQFTCIWSYSIGAMVTLPIVVLLLLSIESAEYQ